MSTSDQNLTPAPQPVPEVLPRPFQCSSCNNSYIRIDHLTRHARKVHSNYRPYVCSICPKTFGRKDLQRRHVKNHKTESANKQQKPKNSPNDRVVQACEACSRRHVRCRDEKPCTRCKKFNIPCRVPESELNKLDAVHAARNLPDLSDGFDFPSALPPPQGEHQASMAPNNDMPSPSGQFDPFSSMRVPSPSGQFNPSSLMRVPSPSGQFNPSSLTASTTMMATGNGTMPIPSATASSLRQPSMTPSSLVGSGLDSLTVDQQYSEDTGAAWFFLEDTLPQFNDTTIEDTLPRSDYTTIEDTLPQFNDTTIEDTLPRSDHTTSIDPFLPNYDYSRNMPSHDADCSGQATPRGTLGLNFDMDVGMTDIDMDLLNQYNFDNPFAANTLDSDNQGIVQYIPESESVPVRTEAFEQSIWRYLPQRHKDSGGAEQGNLAYIDSEKNNDRPTHTVQRRAITERLHSVSRDRLMALVLGTCSPANVEKIASAFPSIESLDALIQFFFTSPSFDAQSWFHLPTFSPSKISPEVLAVIISAGAVSRPDIPLRELGFTLHEASRINQVKAFEADNTAIRDLQHFQILLLELQVGMWSGISRKMEIADSFLHPLITMLRRGSRFRRCTWRHIIPPAEDSSTSLETLWQEWVYEESYLRLVYRSFELDRQSSMALLKPPLISYSEMKLPLPSPNVLWEAKTASAWRLAYLSMPPEATSPPSAHEVFLDFEQLPHDDGASATYLHMTWGLVWEYRQMSTLAPKSHSKANSNLILSTRYQELVQQLEDFRVSSPTLSKGNEITLELMLLHLNAPLEEVRLFAGQEGQEEARAAYSALHEWTKTVSARQALWHAGQILCAAERLPHGLLRDFNAIAVYHAGLVLWAFGSLKRYVSDGSTSSDTPQAIVILNGDDAVSARQFITFDYGVPSILQPGSYISTQLSDVSGVMDGLINLLWKPHDAVEGSCPPLVGNLVQLLEGLRSATR